MKVVIYSGKGGCGKSMLTAQLIYNGFEAIDLDPFGDIFDRFEDKSIFIEENEAIPWKELNKEQGDIVIDFKGGKDSRLKEALDNSDLLIIPVIPSIESINTTLKTIDYIGNTSIKILFVINMIEKPINLKETVEVLNEFMGEEIDYATIKLSKAYRTSINNNESIIAMAKRGGIQGSPYKTHRKEIEAFLDKVEAYR